VKAYWCTRMELGPGGQPTGKILDISLVEDDHMYGVSEDRTELHWPADANVDTGQRDEVS
jgi:hypothetical protein